LWPAAALWHLTGEQLPSGLPSAVKSRLHREMGIVEEELDESLLWFDLPLASGEQVREEQANRLSGEAHELLAMTVQSILTARGGSR
jgi:hypothetical protein